MSLPPTCEEELASMKYLYDRAQTRLTKLVFTCERFLRDMPYDWPVEIEQVLDDIRDGRL